MAVGLQDALRGQLSGGDLNPGVLAEFLQAVLQGGEYQLALDVYEMPVRPGHRAMVETHGYQVLFAAVRQGPVGQLKARQIVERPGLR